jgi:phage shock protein C
MNKRLYRSTRDSMICGVCGGIAEYFDVDPTIVRLIAVVLIFGWGSGLLAYLVGAIIIPKNPYQ